MHDRIVAGMERKDRELWSRHTVRLRHALGEIDLFSDANIASLIEKLPRERVAINTMSPSGHKADSWSYVDRAGHNGEAIVEMVKSGRLWINITQIEKLDGRFAQLLEQLFSELQGFMPGFSTFKRSVGLLISSPTAQVFYHADVPGQSLWQIRGRKRIYLYPASEPFLRPAEMEKVVRGITEEEITYEPWFDEHAEIYDLEPGQMLHWELNRPHRVTNLEGMNVSLTTEHWTPEIRRSYAMNYGNGVLRELGLSPKSRSLDGPAFWGKVGLTAAWRASGLHRRRAFKRKVNISMDDLKQASRAVPAE
jgi:hypothetical protein